MDSILKMTSPEMVPVIVEKLRASFLTGKTRCLEYRKRQLKQLYFLVHENQQAFTDAIYKDLGRPSMETSFGEIITFKNDCLMAIKNLKNWAKDEHVWPGLPFMLHSTYVRKDPKGTVLVLGAWNYPITVQLSPMIGAIAAGNTAVLKPSEISAHTAQLIADLWPKYMDLETTAVVNGAIPQAQALLDERWEHIFYTGNGRVGSIVAEKAAKFLCPVTLELGGKSPVIIDDSANLSIAAHRILWAKSFNTGQTCIAPDYVLVDRKIQDKFIDELLKARRQFGKEFVSRGKDIGRIVSANHWKRIRNLAASSKADLVVGGVNEADEESRFMPLTVFKNVHADDATMGEEIFGPILPIIPIGSIREAVDFVNARDQPLALYMFTENKDVSEYIMKYTRSGAVVRGDMLIHFVIDALPFGGTGPAGFGAYHGQHSFECFSHRRSVVVAPAGGIIGFIVEKIMSMRYPPYTGGKNKFFQLVLSDHAGFGHPREPTKSSTSVDQPIKRVSTYIVP
ncbi:hypothetical protein MCAP1_002968 [Malassezia caprae]|uniref:Aldehyde dehydrogenase n=1 Tax=Malassezia caprae TaxID=1381934 RepID=A0AAF0EDF5_9BASI|nr:hypothetical protein MCAP1_002968 [Malassezia caprae]